MGVEANLGLGFTLSGDSRVPWLGGLHCLEVHTHLEVGVNACLGLGFTLRGVNAFLGLGRGRVPWFVVLTRMPKFVLTAPIDATTRRKSK